MKQILFALAFLILVISQGFAQKPVTIAAWNFFGQESSGINNLSPTATAENVTAGGLIRGKGLAEPNAKVKNFWGANRFSSNQEGPQDAISKEKFITFSITSTSKKPLSFQQINPMKIRIFSVGPMNYTFQYSMDGLNFNDITTTKLPKPDKQSDLVLPAVDLSLISDLQNISSGKTVTFRIAPRAAANDLYSHFYFGSRYDVPSLVLAGFYEKR